MSKLLEQLEHLDRAVPEAPGFADSIVDVLRDKTLPATPRAPYRLSRRRFAVAAIAASILISVTFMFALSAFTLSPQRAFGQMLKNVEQLDSVQYSDVAQDTSGHSNVDRRTIATGGRRRSELKAEGFPLGIFVHNQQASPDCDLWIYPDKKRAEFELVDQEREALEDENPVAALKKLMMTGVKTAPDENYAGKAARAFISAEPESAEGTWVRRVLVDKKTDLPLRIEIESKIAGQKATFRQVMDQFDWHPTINESTFSTKVPAGFAVTYDLIKPLSHALDFYAALCGQLPRDCGADALKAFRKKLDEQSAADGRPIQTGVFWDAEWGFSVQSFAAKHQIDFRYYGAGKTLSADPGKSPERIAAIETAPGSKKYDVLLSDFSRERVDRSQLP